MYERVKISKEQAEEMLYKSHIINMRLDRKEKLDVIKEWEESGYIKLDNQDECVNRLNEKMREVEEICSMMIRSSVIQGANYNAEEVKMFFGIQNIISIIKGLKA